MPRHRLIRTFAACAAALALALTVAACGDRTEAGVDHPAREGLNLPLGGLEYNVFLTRELNLKIEEDKAYFAGPPAPPGKSLYAVFVQVCNHGKDPKRMAEDFVVVDNQGNRFYPIKLARTNPFAYNPRVLAADQCAPASGSVAQLGPTGGLMVLFQFPLQNTENRPLELEVAGPFDATAGKREKLTFELDI
jgi:hypothetical protein